MTSLVWIGLAIVGIHLVVAWQVIVQARKAVKILDETSQTLSSAANNTAGEVQHISENISRIGQKTHSAIKILSEI